MNNAIIFIETYHAGGHEKVADTLLKKLNFNRIDLFINKRYATRLLEINSLGKNVHIHYYSLMSPNEISLKIQSTKSSTLRIVLKIINIVLKYFLIWISIVYFYIRFKQHKAETFIALNGGYPGGEYCRSSLIASTLCNHKKIFTTFFNKPSKSRIFFSFIENLYDKYLDANVSFICDSNKNANLLSKVRNIKQKPFVIYNGLEKKDKKNTFMKNGVLSLLNIANFEDRKNQIMLIDVINKLVSMGYRNVHLTLIGSETEKYYKRNVINYISTLNVEKYISCLDFCTNLDSYYYDSDIFLLSSKGESFPLVTLAALSYGIPVIATEVGGVNEQIIDASNGFLIKSKDVSDMVKKIIFFIDNKEQLNIFGQNAYDSFIQNFELNKMIYRYSEVLDI